MIPVLSNKDYLFHNLPFVRISATELANKLISIDSVLEDKLYPAEVRLCRYIINANEKGYYRDIMNDVACSIGTSYRHLYRMLNTLCEDNLLKKIAYGYQIINEEELKKRSEID